MTEVMGLRDAAAFLEVDDAIIAATADLWFGPIVAVALYTGMRQGELLGLRWEDVDLKRESVTVRNSLARLPGRHGTRYVLTEPKSAVGGNTVGVRLPSSAPLSPPVDPVDMAAEMATQRYFT